MLQANGRRDSLDRAISELASQEPFADVVGRLVCLRRLDADRARLDRRAR